MVRLNFNITVSILQAALKFIIMYIMTNLKVITT